MVKALFPIGKTQWSKWSDDQRTAFNETRAAGVPFADAVKYVNELKLVEVKIAPEPKKNIVAEAPKAAKVIPSAVSIIKTVAKKAK